MGQKSATTKAGVTLETADTSAYSYLF